MRLDGRKLDELREIKIIPDYLKHPEGSVMICYGDTKVICSATVENRVPPFLRGQGKGWVTAEYAMLPRATHQRNIRESSKGKITGRTMEIQRLIGRSLRSVIDLSKLGERTIWIDCDVIQADGGTRTASITGAFLAMGLAVNHLLAEGIVKESPITAFLSAVSVGIVGEDAQKMLDLDFSEDSSADVDMNIVMTSDGKFVEIQGAGEEATFTRIELNEMLDLAEKGLTELLSIQQEFLPNL